MEILGFSCTTISILSDLKEVSKGEFINSGGGWNAKEVVHLNPVLLREYLTTHILENWHHCAVLLQLTDKAHSYWSGFSRVSQLEAWERMSLFLIFLLPALSCTVIHISKAAL